MAKALTQLAVVTGAGSGLGRAFCLELAAAGGWYIIALDKDDAALSDLIEAARPATSDVGATVIDPEPFDVTDRDAWRRIANRLADGQARGALPPLTLVVNNAGICAAAEAFDPAAIATDQWRRIMEVNFFGVVHGCQVLGPLLCESAAAKPTSQSAASESQPAIVNVASIAAYLAAPSMSAYAASKSAVVAFSEALHAELRPHGVCVTIVAPGFFQTNLLDRGEFCTKRHRAEAERLSRNAKFTAADVARAALKAARRGDLYCVVGRRARWLWRAKRLAPRSLYRIIAKSYHRTFPND